MIEVALELQNAPQSWVERVFLLSTGRCSSLSPDGGSTLRDRNPEVRNNQIDLHQHLMQGLRYDVPDSIVDIGNAQ